MVLYKWVIKKDNKYFPVINNGAYPPFNDLDLGYYQKGKTIKNFINPYNLIPNRYFRKQKGFHRTRFHFWINKNNRMLKRYQNCMKQTMNKQINCILKCYIRIQDIIMQDNDRIIAKKFRILGEIK